MPALHVLQAWWHLKCEVSRDVAMMVNFDCVVRDDCMRNGPAGMEKQKSQCLLTHGASRKLRLQWYGAGRRHATADAR